MSCGAISTLQWVDFDDRKPRVSERFLFTLKGYPDVFQGRLDSVNDINGDRGTIGLYDPRLVLWAPWPEVPHE